jgi:hypothetical protein
MIERRLAEEFAAGYTPGRGQSLMDLLEEAFLWLRERSIPEALSSLPQSDDRELVERLSRLDMRQVDAPVVIAEAKSRLLQLSRDVDLLREVLERIQKEDTRTERTPHLSYADDRELWTERKIEGRCAKIAREARAAVSSGTT